MVALMFDPFKFDPDVLQPAQRARFQDQLKQWNRISDERTAHLRLVDLRAEYLLEACNRGPDFSMVPQPITMQMVAMGLGASEGLRTLEGSCTSIVRHDSDAGAALAALRNAEKSDSE